VMFSTRRSASNESSVAIDSAVVPLRL